MCENTIARCNLESPIICQQRAGRLQEASLQERAASPRSPPLWTTVTKRKNLPTNSYEVSIDLRPQMISPSLERSNGSNESNSAGSPSVSRGCLPPVNHVPATVWAEVSLGLG